MATVAATPALRTARLRAGWLLGGVVAALAAALAGLVVGPVAISPLDVMRELAGVDTDTRGADSDPVPEHR